MNRADRRAAEKACRLGGHLTKTDGTGQMVPWCLRCAVPLPPLEEQPK